MKLLPITLDDGQVIDGRLGDLSQHQIISLANQLRRLKHTADADNLMEYQHKRFYEAPLPLPPRAA